MAVGPAPILVFVGTKAQFIKTAPVLREFDRRNVPYRLVYTGQHSETFDVLERAFGTRKPDDVLVPGTEADSARGLVGWGWRFAAAAARRLVRGTWRGARWGVVHGDTASTLLSAIVLRLARVPVAHVEAGLRSPRLLDPFPEEIVRRLVSRLTALHLAPDATAAANLDGLDGRVDDTGGNTLRDALQLAMSTIGPLPSRGGEGGYAVVSMHRAENLVGRTRFDFLMDRIVAASRALPVRFVLHPVTRRRLAETGWFARLQAEPGITLSERTDHAGFVRLMLAASCLLTDGGSNQEEAAMLGLPTLLLRDSTERPDGIADGTVVLSRLDAATIEAFIHRHVGRTWTPTAVAGDSPSARVVDALTGQEPVAAPASAASSASPAASQSGRVP